jgi:hypothetical protein
VSDGDNKRVDAERPRGGGERSRESGGRAARLATRVRWSASRARRRADGAGWMYLGWDRGRDETEEGLEKGGFLTELGKPAAAV